MCHHHANYCFDHENRLCLTSFHSHRDPEDEDGEERIVDESDSDPDNSEPEHEADTGPSTEEQEFVEYSLSLGQTGRNDTRKVLTSVMN